MLAAHRFIPLPEETGSPASIVHTNLDTNATQTGKGNVAISPDGTWRAAVVIRHDTAVAVFMRSSDNGGTWTEITAPASAANEDWRVAVADDGTLHATGVVTSQIRHYSYSGGSWSAQHTVANRSLMPDFIGTDGTTLVLMLPASHVDAYYSTDGGSTWTAGSGSSADIHSTGSIWTFVGGYVFLSYIGSGGSAFTFERWNVSTGLWDAPTTLPSFPGVTSNRSLPIILSRHGSTTELYAVVVDRSPASIYLYTSTDSGDNWSTVVSNESLPAGWTATLMTTGPGGASMGADDKLRLWGYDSADVAVISRDLAGVYGSMEVAPISPFTASAYKVAVPSQPQAGSHPNAYELWVSVESSPGTATPTDLLLLRAVATLD